MLEKIRHNLPMKILSVVIAVLFWFMVYTNENPIETRQLNIALTPINEDVLSTENLRILNEYDTEIGITIRGRSSEIEQVSEKDFSAYLDFGTISNEYTDFLEISGLKYLGDRNIIYELNGSGRIGLSVDRIIAGEIPITVEITGETAEGFFLAGGPVLQPANFTVLDIKSIVTEVDSAIVIVDVSGMKGTETVRKFCMLYDENGELINELSNKTAVDITVNIAKSIPVQVKLEGVPAIDHIETAAVPDPTHVLISGSEEELSMIDRVTTLPVNIEGADETFVATTGLQTLPAGLKIVGSGEVEIGVTIETLQEKTIIFNPSNINIRYGFGNKDYDILSSYIELIVKGRKSKLDTITIYSVDAYIDVSNTVDGLISLPLRFDDLDEVEQMSFPLVEVYIQTERSMALYTEDIFLDNRVGGNYTYEFLNTAANLNLIGLSENIDNLDYSSLNPTIDVGELKAGTHTVTIQINLPEGVLLSSELTTQLKITEN